MIDALRTPEDRFNQLPDYPFAPHYVDDLPGYDGLRVHYLDEGSRQSDRVFLCLHGEPSWSYLYRKMIPIFAESGARVIAPDWLGFGKSDKPVDTQAYSFNFHREMMMAFIARLDLKNLTLVCQDWGGLLGLTIPQDMSERFSRLIVMNTAISTGKPAGQGFKDWLAFIRANPDIDVGGILARGAPLSRAEIAAYNAPFPDVAYKSGVRAFPELVMIDPEMQGVNISKRAMKWWSQSWQGQSFMAVGMKDTVISYENMKGLQQIIKGCPEPLCINDGDHFVQEWGEEIATEALRAFGDA